MDCSTLQRHQILELQETMSSQSLDSMIMCTKSQNSHQQTQQEKKPRPADEHAMKCPRCDSANTKFCYYNNYSLSQPRYFCKSCRRYWTKGGTLRNVPVGGGCRKNRRSSSSSKKSTPDHHLQVPALCITNPTASYDHHTGLSLAHGNISLLGNHGNSQFELFGNPNGNSFLDSLRSGLIESNHSLYYNGIDNCGGNSSMNLSHEDGQDIAMHQFDNNNHNYYYSNPEIMSNSSSGSSTPTAVKQELAGENRILWGFPWQQLNGEGWNGAIVGSSLNNFLNSPLM